MVRPLFGKVPLTDDWNNVQHGVRMPVYSILCDGDVFGFFSFNGSTKPSLVQSWIWPKFLNPSGTP